LKCLVIGPSGAGKTSFCRSLSDRQGVIKKTQDIELIGNFIDTPGEYVENPYFYRRLIVSSQQADLIIFLVAADQKEKPFPHNFMQAFSRPVIGVVNKTDLSAVDMERERAILSYAGVKEPYFFVSVNTGDGLEDLLKRIS
jgi:ethanolamine utilization protein EutP